MAIASEQWTIWQARLAEILSERRYAHCLRVSQTAASMARHWGLDEEKAAMAGLLHDVARDMPTDELLQRAQAAGIHVGSEEKANPIILHAPLGEAILAGEWQISDRAVLTAVGLHTVAAPGMDSFCQTLFLADLIEPGRNKWPERTRLTALCYENLELAMAEALQGSFGYLTARNMFIHPRAVAAYEFFRARQGGQERA